MLSFVDQPSTLLANAEWEVVGQVFSFAKAVPLALVLFPWTLAGVLWFLSTVFIVLPPIAFRWIRARLQGQHQEGYRLETAVWTIHGRRYDLTAFAAHHPGGAWALELGRNRDCTGLFESYHVFADPAKLKRILAKYELRDGKQQVTIQQEPWENSTGLVFGDEFHEDVKKMAREYFAETGRSHKMKPWVFGCVLLTIAAEIFFAYRFVMGHTEAVVVLPVLGALLTFNVSHDASHFALSHSPMVNKILAFTSVPMCFNSTAWYIQHIVQHHVYTNDEPDVDLYHFLPFARTSRFTHYVNTFRMQWALIWFALPTAVAHLLLVVPLDLLTKYIDPITKTRRYQQCENVDDLVAGAHWSMLFEFIVSLGWAILNLSVHGIVKGFCRLAVSYSISSILFIFFTQGAHLQETCQEVDKEAHDRSWGKRQVSTSVCFQPESIFWWLASGGLNMQALHHILPTVSATHLRDLYPRFRQVCKKHDVELKEVPGIVCFFRGFLNWVAELANEDIEPKPKTN